MKIIQWDMTIMEFLILFANRPCFAGYCLGDECRVDGGWAAWLTQNIGQCLPNCSKQIYAMRVCTNPRPSGGGRDCEGEFVQKTYTPCTDRLCVPVNGQWAEWTRDENFPCLANCKQVTTFKRTCTKPRPVGGGKKCVGTATKETERACYGGSCVQVDGKWALWTTQSKRYCGSDCQRTLVLTRSCTDPPASGGGRQCTGISYQTKRERCTGEGCVRVDGQWSVWRTHSTACSSSCQRTVSSSRSCTDPRPAGGGTGCPGSNSKSHSEKCTGQYCVRVDGKWTAWRSEIGTCQSDCMQTISLTRTCTNPTPSGGGSECSGIRSDIKRQRCIGGGCVKVDGQWSSWRRHAGKCPSTCHLTVYFNRTCTNPVPSGGGQECGGLHAYTATEKCTGYNCVRVDGQWGAWRRQNVVKCTSRCDREASYTRTCSNPAPSGGGRQCHGISKDLRTETCTGDRCIRVNGQWSAWVKQRTNVVCQSDCRRSVHYTRTCSNPYPSGGGLDCTGIRHDTKQERCNDGMCIKADGQWSAWRTVTSGECLSDCRRRVSLSRTCTNPAPTGEGRPCPGTSTNTVREPCTGGRCVVVDGKWTAWTKGQPELCSSNCKQSVPYTRTCSNPTPAGGGRPCAGLHKDSRIEDCQGGSCITVNGQWAAWARSTVDFCSVSCTRLVIYVRNCSDPAPSQTGLDCSGKNMKRTTELCFGDSCVKVNGRWTAWKRKTNDLCSVDCQQSVSLDRTCTNPAPAGGGLDCFGKHKDVITDNCTGDYCDTTLHSSSQDVSGLSDTYLILIGIGALLLLLLLIIIAIILCWRRMQKKKKTVIREVLISPTSKHKHTPRTFKLNVSVKGKGDTQQGSTNKHEAMQLSQNTIDHRHQSTDHRHQSSPHKQKVTHFSQRTTEHRTHNVHGDPRMKSTVVTERTTEHREQTEAGHKRY